MKILGIKNLNVRLKFADNFNVISDIEILINSKQRKYLLKNFHKKHVSFENSCSTFLLTNQIAKFNEKCWSAVGEIKKDKLNKEKRINTCVNSFREFAKLFTLFEGLINSYDPVNDLQKLKEYLNSLKKVLEDEVDNIRNSHYKKDIKKRVVFLKSVRMINEFEKQIADLESGAPTISELRELFLAQTLRYGKKSLGEFVCNQLCLFIDEQMNQIYSILDNRFKQLFYMHPALKVISDAKKDIAKKGRSLYAARYNNTRTKIPPAMLDIDDDSESADEKWFSIKPYVDRLDNLEKVENIIAFITDSESTRKCRGISPWYKVLIFFASVVELPLAFLHIVTSLFCSILPWRIELSKWLSDIHHKLSPLRHARAFANKKYRMRSDFNKEFVDKIRDNNISMFNYLIDKYISADLIFLYLKSGFNNFFGSLRNIILDGFYVLFSFNRNKAQQRIIKQMNKKINILNDELLLKINDHFDNSIQSSSNTHGKWKDVPFWEVNNFNSPLDFVDEIMVGLSDVLLDPMFRKSPGLATMFFALSMASLTVTLLPTAAASKLGIFGKILEIIPSFLSKSFTGKSISDGVFEKVIASFLQWKAGFFISEATIEGLHGDFEFLDSIFGETEKITLGLMVLISIGVSFQFVPKLPVIINIDGHKIINPVAGVINFFTEQAKHCAHGKIPFNGLEFAFLGLKSMLLLYSLSSGKNKSSITVLDVENFLREFTAELSSINDDKELKSIFLKYNIPDYIVYNLLENFNFINNRSVECQPNGFTRSRKHLDEQFIFINNLEFNGIGFPSKFKAKCYYDYLNEAFDEYNHNLCLYGHFDKQIEKSEFLDLFFNKYCYSGSSNFIKAVSIALYPLTCLWRGIKYLMAAHTESFKSAATVHQINKSFSKELAIFLQVFAILGRFFEAIGRALRNVFQIHFHKIEFLAPLKPVYARASREAGNISDLRSHLDILRTNLQNSNDYIWNKKTESLVEYYKEKNERRGVKAWTTSSARDKQLMQIASVLNNPCKNKNEEISLIVKKMRPGKLSAACGIFAFKPQIRSMPNHVEMAGKKRM